MSIVLPSEVLGQPGVFDFLEKMSSLQEIKTDLLLDLLQSCGIKTPHAVFEQLSQISIIFEADNNFYLSPKGHELWSLLQAINDGDIKKMVQRLRHSDPTLFPYEIVTEGMTSEFISGLASFPSFRRLLICSPWVHLKRKVLQKFAYALYQATEKSSVKKVDVIVIVRPLRKRDPNYHKFLDVFQALIKLGAEIVVHNKLHSKLYIRDPGIDGGFSQAIFGSENLTGTRNIELGIRITNDTVIINKLISYFFDLYQQCNPYQED